MTDEQDQLQRAKGRIAVAVSFLIALIIDIGLGISQRTCDSCGPPSNGQRGAFLVATVVGAAIGVACLTRRRGTLAMVVFAIAGITLVRWLFIAVT